MKKQHILEEIKRTATANGGKALGRERFEKETGIKMHEWYGKFWPRWGDALIEAGFTPNRLRTAYDDSETFPKLVAFIRELGRYPTSGELQIRERNVEGFPTVFSGPPGKGHWVARLAAYCETNAGHDDVASICAALVGQQPTPAEPSHDGLEVGYVYLALMRVGREKRHKVGKADIVERRKKQIGPHLPEELELVHTISTDDAYGIEAYWHKRFAAKRRGGEWFELSASDVKAFKRRKFM